MEYEYLTVGRSGAVLEVTVNRPAKRNALSQGVLAEIGACFTAHADDDSLVCATVRGAGEKCFAAGGDLHEFDRLRSPADAERIGVDSSTALDAMRQFPVPVYGLLNGDAIGGGAEFALACDVRIAAAHTRMAFVQATLNIAPAWGGGSDLVREVGGACALHLLSRADFLSAGQAQALGLVQAVCPDGQSFDDFAADYMAPIAARRPQVMRAIKALVLAHRRNATPPELRQTELAALAETWCHADHWEAHDRVLARISGSA